MLAAAGLHKGELRRIQILLITFITPKENYKALKKILSAVNNVSINIPYI